MRIRSMMVVVLLSCIAGCAEKPQATPMPAQYHPQGMVASFDPRDWQSVLSKVVAPDGNVRWDIVQKDQAVRDALMRYLALLGTVSPDNRPDLFQTSADRLAYWINAYNATSAYLVIRQNYPTTAPSSADVYLFGGVSLTLDDVKARAKQANDPRMYFALNNASRSSPPLRNEPYDGVKLNVQLKDQGIRYLHDPRAVVLEDDGETVKLNTLLTGEAGKEFIDLRQKQTGKSATLLEALRPFAAKHSPVQAADHFESMGFDSSLNRAAIPATTAPVKHHHPATTAAAATRPSAR